MSGGRKIILHPGLHKTGTSTIQNVLHANRDFLLEQERVLYPSLASNLSTPLNMIFNDNPLKQLADKLPGLTDEEIAIRRKNYLESLDTEVSSLEWNKLLLSAESVSNLSEAEIARLREWGEKYSSDWTVLVCVRHPVDWARSVVQQQLKGGATLQQLYENPPLPNFRGRVSRFVSIFGKENIRVFDFEAAAEGKGGIVGNFAVQAGLAASSGDFLASRTVHANESLSLEAVQLLDSLNRRHPTFVDGVRTERRAGPGRELPYIRRIEGRKFDVPDPVKENIRLRSHEDVAWLNETFGLDLYRDIVNFSSHREPHEKPVEAWDDSSVDTTAEIISELVAKNTFHLILNQGRAALTRNDLGRAEKMLREATRLDPDAPQPKKLLRQLMRTNRKSY